MPFSSDTTNAPFGRPKAGLLTWLIVGLVGAFLVQNVIQTFFPPAASVFLSKHVAQSADALMHGRVWTLASTAILHAGLLHLLFSCLCLYIFGREVLSVIGPKQFLTLFGGSVVFGNLVFALVSLVLRTGPGIYSIGVSAGVSALIAFYACVFADRQMSFMFVPIAFRPKHFVAILAGIDVFYFVFGEIPGKATGSMPSAMLGGMAAGWLFFRFVYRPGALFQSYGPAIEMPAWLRRKKKVPVAVAAASYKVNVSPQTPADVRAEVDRILDKINLKGFGALTTDERRLLDEARDTLNKR